MKKVRNKDRNKHGLTRYLSADLAREVRKRSDFGCLFCGDAIIVYDHFEPEFKDARRHDPAGIVALCGTHHAKRGSGEISVEMVKRKLAENDSQQTISRTDFELNPLPEIQIGKATMIGIRKIIEIDDEQILSFSPPEIPRTAPLLNAKFYDKKGHLCAEIIDNEWRGYKRAWDIENIGNRYTVRSGRREIALRLQITDGKVHIDRLNMNYSNASIKVKPNGVTSVVTSGEDGAKLVIPDVPSRTVDWFHWIKINGSSITWCSESIHTLLADVPANKLPLPVTKLLNFGKHKTVMTIPVVRSAMTDLGDTETNEIPHNPHGEFEKITLHRIGLCPHSNSDKLTMYLVENKESGENGNISTQPIFSMEWAHLAREAQELTRQRPVPTAKILSTVNNALVSLMQESGKVQSYAYLIARKLECLAAMKRLKEFQKTYEELLSNAPQYNWSMKLIPTEDKEYFKVTFGEN